jgi:hypothetical protein
LAVGINAGTVLRQIPSACAQRKWKWQPGGGDKGEGNSPAIGRKSTSSSPSVTSFGTLSRSARV